MKFRRLNLLGQLLVAASLFAVAPLHASDRNITDTELLDESNTADWLAYGRTHSEQRFSPLKDINLSNISKLKPAWYTPLPDKSDIVGTPLVVDGIMYYVGEMNRIRAIDARTGKMLWEFDPNVAAEIEKGRMRKVFWKHSRGLSTYGDKLFVATWDGRLVAVNRKSGKQVWETRTFPHHHPLNITGHPKAYDGKVFIGNGGTELGPMRGFVTAYDAETGKKLWRFYIVPGDPRLGFEDEAQEMAAKTWNGEWWTNGGGGNAWHGWTYDKKYKQLIFGTGNGGPWNAKERSPGGGDNLFLSSVVAVDGDTGKYKWHVQTAPGDTWDYNSNMDIVLADLKIDGKKVDAALHAPKNGFFYVIDRSNGKVISAEKFADANWSTKFDLKTQRHIVPDSARYLTGKQNIYPSAFGAHSWHAMSYNPQLGLAFIPTNHLGNTFMDNGKDHKPGHKMANHQLYLGLTGWALTKDPHPTRGSLQAWDPIKNKRVWQVNHKNAWGGGTLTTAGNLVFQGLPTGKLKAYDARNGKVVWEYDAGIGISAPPITYKLDGKQMISLLVGPGGALASNFGGGGELGFEGYGWKYGVHERRVITFTLDGNAVIPKQPAPEMAQPIFDKKFKVDDKKAGNGAGTYAVHLCVACHGGGAVSGIKAPDLRESPVLLKGNEKMFESIVRGGALLENGMPKFPTLTDEELDNIRHYIRKQAHEGAKSGAGH
ncbi:MAG: PQQ-dependent dehydrogenase, methanol/ethanol family [Rhodomicrobiaceae bacterium]